jgi:hypothetical protein
MRLMTNDDLKELTGIHENLIQEQAVIKMHALAVLLQFTPSKLPARFPTARLPMDTNISVKNGRPEGRPL